MRRTLLYQPITNPRIFNSAQRVSTYRNQSTARISPTSCNGRLTAWRTMIVMTSEPGIPDAPISRATAIKLRCQRRVRIVNYVDEWDIHILKQVQTDWGYVNKIGIFNDTAAMLNLLDLRSIMGCPEGTRSVFTCAFRARRKLHCAFLV